MTFMIKQFCLTLLKLAYKKLVIKIKTETENQTEIENKIENTYKEVCLLDVFHSALRLVDYVAPHHKEEKHWSQANGSMTADL